MAIGSRRTELKREEIAIKTEAESVTFGALRVDNADGMGLNLSCREEGIVRQLQDSQRGVTTGAPIAGG